VIEDSLARARDVIASASRVTVLTGAGISTDAGIPDFRGPQGVWTKNPKAEKMSTLSAYIGDREVRELAWQSRLRSPVWEANPTRGHLALVELERAGVLHAIITQNIDRLHHKAGNDPSRIYEVHGNALQTLCWSCGDVREMTEAIERVRSGETDPSCVLCNGILKSTTILIEAAMRAAEECDVLLAVGSTLSVYPAAYAVPRARSAGARIVIVNGSPTEMDSVADVVVNGSISEVLPAIVGWTG
jgi:NAD-dependent deacetylase